MEGRRGQRISKGEGGEILNVVVSNGTRTERPRLRRDRVQGKGCALSLGKKILKNWPSQKHFQSIFPNLCSFNKLEGKGRKGGGGERLKK